MHAFGYTSSLEDQIDQWRNYLRRRQAIHQVDVAELEDHLREQVGMLVDAGLSSDEAFLVAVKRIGDLDTLSREFAREHSDRLWKQLVVPADSADARVSARLDVVVAFCLAVAAAIAVKIPALFGLHLEEDAAFYQRNLSFFVLPFLAGYFVWKRGFDPRMFGWLAVPFVAAAAIVNLYPFEPDGFTGQLAALHLPIALWLVVGIAYAGGRWQEGGGRMDFIRFSGELFIYYVLIALGGGVLTMFLAVLFDSIGIDAERFISEWLLPCGAAGAVLVAAWLVESKQSVIENMAPVLTRLFTPLFAGLLVTFLGALAWTGLGIDIERSTLAEVNFLLMLVLGLLLYSISARDPQAPFGFNDVLQVVLVVSALLAGCVALWAIVARIIEYGFSPNRVVVLGMNVILLVNLAWSAVLYIRFVREGAPFRKLERWQIDYVPAYAIWGAAVVVLLPLLFGFE